MLAALALAPATPVFADGGDAKARRDDGFEVFCKQWMKKLEARERNNLESAKPRSSERGVIVEYTGYAKTPVRCESRVKRVDAPGVGVLVYHEIKYRRQGADRAAARSNDPKVVERVEVTEVFRYDGASWAY